MPIKRQIKFPTTGPISPKMHNKPVAINAMRTAFSRPLPLKANAAKNIDSPKNKCHATSSIANIIDGHSQPRNRT